MITSSAVTKARPDFFPCRPPIGSRRLLDRVHRRRGKKLLAKKMRDYICWDQKKSSAVLGDQFKCRWMIWTDRRVKIYVVKSFAVEGHYFRWAACRPLVASEWPLYGAAQVTSSSTGVGLGPGWTRALFRAWCCPVVIARLSTPD